jgi:hypothetical protein
MASRRRFNVHASGVCESDLESLAIVIEKHINQLRFDLAFQQLETCASERENDMNYYKQVQRANKNRINEQHQYIIDRVRGLMEKIKIGLRIGVTSNEWRTVKIFFARKYFIIKYKPDHLDDYVEIKRTTTNRLNPPSPLSLSPLSSSPSLQKMTKSMKRRLKRKSKKTIKNTSS